MCSLSNVALSFVKDKAKDKGNFFESYLFVNCIPKLSAASKVFCELFFKQKMSIMQSYRISYWYLACFSNWQNCALRCISKRTTKGLFTIDTCTVNDRLSASTIFHPYYGPISMVHFVSLLITGQSAQCVLVNRSLGTNQLSVLSWTAHRFFHLLPWFDLSVLSISSQMNMKGSKAELCEAYPMWPNLIMTDAMPSQLTLAFDYNEHGDSWHHTIHDTYTSHVTPEVMQLLSELYACQWVC